MDIVRIGSANGELPVSLVDDVRGDIIEQELLGPLLPFLLARQITNLANLRHCASPLLRDQRGQRAGRANFLPELVIVDASYDPITQNYEFRAGHREDWFKRDPWATGHSHQCLHIVTGRFVWF